MRILLTGASGFIGRRLAIALLDAGHAVHGVGRAAAPFDPRLRWSRIDMNRAVTADDWRDAVRDVDAVINAAGILRGDAVQSMDAIHAEAPRALFQAAARAGVGRILQISALGADAHASTAYHRSKRAADDSLIGLGVPFTVLQPSLVYGPGGASARFFGMMASLPLIPLPGGGRQPVQPVHIDDLIGAMVALLMREPDQLPPRLEVVGPAPLALRDYYAALRDALGIARPARFMPVPMPLVALAARVGGALPGALLDTDTLAMLTRGNTGDAGPLTRLLGRAPRPVARFVAPDYAAAVSRSARLDWLLPVLRLSIALVWIVTAIVSFGLYPIEESRQLLARAGVPAVLRDVALYGAAMLDLVFGICVLWPRRRRGWWLAQAGLVLGYTAIITFKLPEFWLHPYGPVLKNLPFLAALWLLYEMEDRRWNT